MNIYITKDNVRFLKALPGGQSMSGIINKLLNDYRAGNAYDIFPPGGREVIEPIEVVKVVPAELKPKFCKNGHPIPYPKSTCMGKGCKYS